MNDTKIHISKDKIECGLIVEDGKVIHFDYDLFNEGMTRDFDRRKELEAENKRLKSELNEVVTLGRQVANECSNMGAVFGKSPVIVGTWDELIGRLAIQDKERK